MCESNLIKEGGEFCGGSKLNVVEHNTFDLNNGQKNVLL
jgi:hypothetical protein